MDFPLLTLSNAFLLSISDQRIASVAINSSGDWIAFGCSGAFSIAIETEPPEENVPEVQPRSGQRAGLQPEQTTETDQPDHGLLLAGVLGKVASHGLF
jgi:hypothetical protein